ncbi:MAG: ATP-binding cassette domain-containing protein [Treponemataceae bacterium]
MNDISAVELAEVTVRFGEYEVLRNLSASFPVAQATFIIGKAGSGKSTLLKTAAGLVVPDDGSVFRLGKDLARMNRVEETEFRKSSAFAFQDAALWANQSIYNNLTLPLFLHFPHMPKTELDKRVRETALRVGYSESLALRPADLSAGEQKLISLARAIILDPELIFLDEPTASLDEDSVERVLEIIGEFKAAGKTLIVISHRARVIAELADFLCVVSEGKVVNFGPAEQIAQLVGGELLKRIRTARRYSGEESAIDDPDDGA